MGSCLMKTVLIIDDEPTYRKVTGELLRQHGWEVLQADEGDEGIRVAKAHRPQIILCDLLMPRCNGFQVCRAIRADESLRNTRIVVTSGRDFGSDRQAAFAAGADEYLTKPINSAQLLKLISSLVGRAASPERETPGPVPSNNSVTRLKFWGVRGSIP